MPRWREAAETGTGGGSRPPRAHPTRRLPAPRASLAPTTRTYTIPPAPTRPAPPLERRGAGFFILGGLRGAGAPRKTNFVCLENRYTYIIPPAPTSRNNSPSGKALARQFYATPFLKKEG